MFMLRHDRYESNESYIKEESQSNLADLMQQFNLQYVYIICYMFCWCFTYTLHKDFIEKKLRTKERLVYVRAYSKMASQYDEC